MIWVFTDWYFWTDFKNNIHALAIEMYKVANDMSLNIMNEILELKILHYNLWHTSHFSDLIHRVYKSTSYLGPKIWEQMTVEIKK